MKIGISAEIPAFAGMECTFFRSFCGNGKFYFRREFPRSPRHSRERGNPFLPTNPRIHLVFHKKMRGNSKINLPEWIPAFAGMTAFFRRIPPRFHSDENRNLRRDSGVRRNGMYFFPVVLPEWQFLFRRRIMRGWLITPFVLQLSRLLLFVGKKSVGGIVCRGRMLLRLMKLGFPK